MNPESCLMNKEKKDFLYDYLFEDRDADDNEKEVIAENPGKYVMYLQF